jgi:mannosyltransferase
MWFDEGFSIAIARGSWTDLWAVVTASDANGALHSMVLWVWMRATEGFPGADDLARARALSVVAGAATVPAVYAVGRALLGRGAALAAAALLAVNQLHAYYSNEARGYVLLALLVTVASWLLVRALEAPSPARWAAYSCVAALSAYAHVFGGLSVAAQLLAALLYPCSRPDEARMRRGVVVSGAAILVLVAPLLYYAVTHPSYASWISPLQASAVPRFFQHVAGDTRLAPVSLRAVLPILEGACVVLALAAGGRLRRRDRLSREAWAILFVASWVFVPVVLALLVSLAKPIFVDRYLLAVVPGWLLLVAAGVFSRWRGKAAAGAVVVLLALSLSGTLRPRPRDPPKAFPWDDVAAHVLDRASARDALVFSHPTGIVPFEHHARGHPRGAEAPGLVWPAPGDAHTLRTPALSSMLEPLGAHRRVWFVLFGEQEESKALRAALEERGHAPAEDIDLDGVRVLRYER